VRVACHIPLESSWQGIELYFKPHLNQRRAQKVMGLQNCKSLNFENFDEWQNDIWVSASWPSIENTIKGKVVASPSLGRGEFCEFVFTRGSLMHQKCSNYALTNLLFNLCRSMWIIDPLVTHPNPHPKAPTRTSTPKVLRAKECTPTPYPSNVFTLDS
jgi:hypothetical protein